MVPWDEFWPSLLQVFIGTIMVGALSVLLIAVLMHLSERFWH